ncbi:AcrR family transcriptional regulator [Peribacillus simplex]|uniref:TetR/AcrR family transcriptional regulator n=1 Tax=Peribacillus simplex TaxID=1478 RepID=UPI0024E1FBD4|nr:TetR/AcrR family transcriptional regulator [Peribacillus simplex]MDF9761653.1 AcrR family transcriptional regulator [Peribacillus simplex]
MVKEKGLKGKETKARIKEAATYEFATHGFYNTKVSDIVKRANLTQPGFYLYFSSKDAIFDELVMDFRNKLHMLIETQRLSPKIEKEDLTQRILISIEILFQFFIDNPDLTKVGLILAHDSESFKGKIIELLANNLKYEQQSGYFRSNLSMDITAVCIFGMIEQLITSCLMRNKSNPKILAEEVVNLVIKGIVDQS